MAKTRCFSQVATVVICCLASAAAATAEQWHNQIQPFLRSHCIDCHNGADAEGRLDLTGLGDDLNDADLMRRWVLIHDRLAAGEMPPKDAPRPAQAVKSKALSTLAAALAQADRARSDVVLRRLNLYEYENTIRDLFDVNVRVKDVLPKDTPSHGFDNVGEGLAVSAEAAAAYLRAADVALDAVFGPPQKPKTIKHTTNLLDQKKHDGKPSLARHIGRLFRRTDKGLVIFQSNYCPTNLVNFGRLRPPAGTYRGKLQVRAIQSKEPVTLRIYGGDTVVGRREKHLVGYYDIPPDKWTTITFEDRLVEDGGTFQPKCYGTFGTRNNADTFPGPGIEIGDITIEGPLEEWPPRSRAKLLGDVDLEKGTLEDALGILARILPSAFRRTTKPDEVEPYVNLVKSALAHGRSFEAALRLGLKAVLCSPEFLFLDEPGRETLNQFALASRLSYFLWSSMPDHKLLSLAYRETLDEPQVLREQVKRLLNDRRSKAFTVSFTGQWLNLRDIDFTSPDQKLYPEFDELLKISMVEETHRFFREVLDRNLSLMNFIDADFAYLNQRLAKHYGIEGVKGQAFRKVNLAEDSVRGGVLTQGSVLKVTANGTNTSPVLRGVWVMQNIMGQTVPPPPAEISPVEPDIRGATTLREQLAKHRSEDSCAVCHRKIDPAGFALENFDPIGGWRDNYRTMGEGRRSGIVLNPYANVHTSYKIGLPVDATGLTPGGRAFRDIREFKQLLLEDKRAIARALTHKLLTYALGRRVGFSDRSGIERIVNNIAQQGTGLRALVHEIVQSDMFRRP